MDQVQDANEFDADSNNGMILCGHFIPEELLTKILLCMDAKSLLNGQRVCKCWNMLINDFVWRKKAEMKYSYKFSQNYQLYWQDYYLIYSRNLFRRNLLKNHSGGEGLEGEYWRYNNSPRCRWIIECPPVGVPALPNEPEFENKQHSYVTSYTSISKDQIIDLLNEGFSENILDHIQPPIEVC